ncbi:MAG TPA: efflux RND transporter periplasmic adaptor subunit [Candidatus Eremiobacteraceae bacterium]|nr:efflux RND transporter periplasmic adaptor subunit [Candidatus Eremiobacteraceae bacterium]
MSAALLLAATIAASGCGHRGGGAGGYGGGAAFSIPVAAAPIKRGDIAQTFRVVGTVAPLQIASLSSVVSGNVLLVNGQIGQHVSQGQLLVKIDDSVLQAELRQNQAQLEAAQAHYASVLANASGTVSSANAGLASAQSAAATADSTYQRDRALFKQGFVSQQALDEAQSAAAAADAALRSAQVTAANASLSPQGPSSAVADLRNAKAAVDTASAAVEGVLSQIDLTNVRAPFSGVIVYRAVDPGALAAPGSPLMEVNQLDSVYINANVSGNSLAYVRAGTPVTVSVSSIPGRTWHGTVSYFNMAADPGTVSYTARIRIANPDLALRPGMVAQASFVQSRKTGVLLAPTASVFQTDTGYGMFIIDKGVAKQLPVDIGIQNDDFTEVTGQGLAPNVMAILNHSVTLQPGTPVQPIGSTGGPPAGSAPGGKAKSSKPQGSGQPTGGQH